MDMVRCVIYKEGDIGYTHFDGLLPSNLVPSIGEKIEVYYPDGGYNMDCIVESIAKVFGTTNQYCDTDNRGFYLVIIVSVVA